MWRGHGRRQGRRKGQQGQGLHLARQRQRVKRRQRQVQHWRSLRRLRKPAVVVTVAAKQASNPATLLGLDVARRRGFFIRSQQRAETHSPTRPTWSARRPRCSWAWTEIKPGGFVPACSPGGSLPRRSFPGRRFRSPSDQDVGNSPYRPLAFLSDVRVGSSRRADRAPITSDLSQ